MKRLILTVLTACIVCSCAAPQTFQLSIIGTNDVHGVLNPKRDSGGLVTLSGYVNAVRSARANDGGAVLLIDAGDMWQGTLESNLSEGASVVAAFNALGYTAAAVGNHEFDFGPAGPAPIPQAVSDDPRGALKQRAIEADFPFLAANLIDEGTGEAVRWENVQPSMSVDVQGVKISIIGVMTRNALANAIASNAVGLRVAPLLETIVREATAARAAGANIVIVTAHAGGVCLEFDNPNDISSCKLDREIFSVANALPAGLVDHIFAGHVHQGIAHIVNGISITSSYSRTVAFSRVDLTLERKNGILIDKKVHPPTPLQPVATYEGVDVVPDPTVVTIANRAADFVADVKQRKIGIRLETPFELTNDPESALGNLYTDAMLDAVAADISIHTVNSSIRANLPAGDLSFGSVYEMSPFDNQLAIIELSGAQLRQVISEQAHRSKFRVGFSGMQVEVQCQGSVMGVSMILDDGRIIQNSDTIRVAVANYLALGGDSVFESVMPAAGYELPEDAPLVRDIVIRSLQKRGGSIDAEAFLSHDRPRWTLPGDIDRSCQLNR